MTCCILAKLILSKVKNNRRLIMAVTPHYVNLLKVVQYGLRISVKVHIGVVLLLLSALVMLCIKYNWKSKMLFGEDIQTNFTLQ